MKDCRKTSGKDPRNFKTCPFNATHILPIAQYQGHLRDCPFRGNDAVDDQELYNPHRVVTKTHATCVIPPSEAFWDEEDGASTSGPPQALVFGKPVTDESTVTPKERGVRPPKRTAPIQPRRVNTKGFTL